MPQDAESKSTPNPGSNVAVENGCRCPIIDNHHGNGFGGRFWVNAACPLHGDIRMSSEPKPTTKISVDVYERVLIGGNHLASSLISHGCMPAEQKDYDQVLRDHGSLCADMWVAWKAIMDLRECVEND